jgi:hypothetical protein
VRAWGPVDFDQVADELYGVPPGGFVSLRDERAAGARAEGDAGLSAALKKLRKPTVGAWLANQLVRERPDEVDGLIELGAALRAAQDELAGDRLRELSRRRREVVMALSEEGRVLGRRAGVSVGDAAADELESTLEAAVADSMAGEALRAGRLTSALHYAGTGLEAAEVVAAPGARTDRSHHEPDRREASRRPSSAVREAASAAKTAARRLAEAEAKVASLSEKLVVARASFERAKAEAERLEHEMIALDERLAEADRRRRDAEAVEQGARRRVEELRADGA